MTDTAPHPARARRIVVVPPVLALLPEYAGQVDPIADLRAACSAAVDWLVEGEPSSIGVVHEPPDDADRARGMDTPAGLRVARALLGERAERAHSGDRGGALLVLANGSAMRTEKAPGHLDPRAADFDKPITTALSTGSAEALAGIDLHLAAELWAGGLGGLVALAGSAPTWWRLDYADDPFGVMYWVARWETV